MAQNLSIIVHPQFLHQLLEPPQTLCLFEKLPYDVLQCLASKLHTAQDLLTFGALTKATRWVAYDDMHWKRLCLSKFHVPSDIKPPSWHQLYEFNHTFLYKVLLAQRHERFGRMPNLHAGGGNQFLIFAQG